VICPTITAIAQEVRCVNLQFLDPTCYVIGHATRVVGNAQTFENLSKVLALRHSSFNSFFRVLHSDK